MSGLGVQYSERIYTIVEVELYQAGSRKCVHLMPFCLVEGRTEKCSRTDTDVMGLAGPTGDIVLRR